MSSEPRKVVVVGAGPVGCLAAMAFAKMGWKVDVFESRPEQASASPLISIFFKHKVMAADFNQKYIAMKNLDTGKELSVNFDFCIGADGSYSVIRRQMMRVVR
ncbi:hypothetical protein H0H92_013437 [Tricholoma furcatifolium]|nr:hypothetical protein H0H92_013437 [Tricholoma furcatifolium]